MEATAAARLYEIAVRWEDESTSAEEREELKSVVGRLVGYPVRVACDPDDEEGYVDILVQNTSRRGSGFQDVLELQSSGAFGVATEGSGARLQAIRAACETYNADHGVEFCDDDDSDTEEEDTTSTDD